MITAHKVTRRPEWTHRRRLTLPPNNSPAHARTMAGDACLAWNLPHLLYPALLNLGLTDNAIEHAGTELTVAVSLREHMLHLAVHDHRQDLPQLTEASPRRAREQIEQRGAKRLIRHLSTAWGAMPCRIGKVVWATLDRSDPGVRRADTERPLRRRPPPSCRETLVSLKFHPGPDTAVSCREGGGVDGSRHGFHLVSGALVESQTLRGAETVARSRRRRLPQRHARLQNEGPGAESAGAQGLRDRNTIYRHERRLVVSAPARLRVRVRGSHKRDRRPPLVRWKQRCPRPANRAAGGGRSNGVRPSLSSDFPYLLPRAVRRCRRPTRLHGPGTCDERLTSGEALNLTSAPPPEVPGNLQVPGSAEHSSMRMVDCNLLEPGRCRSGSSPPSGGCRLRL